MTAPRLALLGDAPSIHLQRWALAMAARGFDVHVVTAADAAVGTLPVTALAPVARRLDWFARVPAARRAIAAIAPDLVHAHYVTSYGLLGALGGRRPLVLSAWGSDILVTPRESAMARWLTGQVLRRAALITADSRDVLAEIATYRPRGRLAEVFWGADTARFVPAQAGVAREGFQVASLRAWEPNYRIDVLLRAFATLRAGGPATLHLFGGGRDEAALRALAGELGLGASVRWHGRLPPDALAAALRDCDVSVSVPVSDATSVSLLESMACGLPVVVSDLPANRQWIDADGGRVVDGGDPAAIAAALDALRADPAQRRRLGARNRARIEAEGSSDAQMDRMAALYRELLAGRGRA